MRSAPVAAVGETYGFTRRVLDRMNLTALVIVTAAVVLLLVVVFPYLKSMSGGQRKSGDRRTGADRRQRSIRVPFERRKRHRRAEDAAERPASRLEGDR